PKFTKTVILLEDADQSGRKHTADAAERLAKDGYKIKIARPLGGAKDINAAALKIGLTEPICQIDDYYLRPQIIVEDGNRHVAADHGIAALVAANVPFYQRAGKIQRVAHVKAKNADGEEISVPGIIPVVTPIMERELGRHAHWRVARERKDGIIYLPIDPPNEVAKQILAMVGEWPFAPLNGLIQCPTLRRDGSLLDSEGYDPQTGLYLTSTVALPRLPPKPTREDAEQALKLLCELLDEFPFDSPESKAVALSMQITPVCRAAMTVAPCHLTTAPIAGTGKSYLASTAAMIATGEQLPVEAMAAKYEETEKRLVGSLLAGFPIIGIDNSSHEIQGDLFCQIAEQPMLRVRSLGKSDKFR
ncbi:MAG TPA: hypothetical protein VKB78_11655, partial [Pirellulales bacterium]|nr:hypothetical protein [Pirellulales bacterium]